MVIFIPFFFVYFFLPLFLSRSFLIVLCTSLLAFSLGVLFEIQQKRDTNRNLNRKANAMFVCFYDIECPMCMKRMSMSTNPYNKIEWFASTPVDASRKPNGPMKKKKKTYLSLIHREKIEYELLGALLNRPASLAVIAVAMRFSSWPKIKWNADAKRKKKTHIHKIATDKKNDTKKEKKKYNEIIKAKMTLNIVALDNIFRIIFRIQLCDILFLAELTKTSA